MNRIQLVLPMLIGAAIAGTAMSRAPDLPKQPQANTSLADCRVVDGDTLRCGSERIRLLGIDAPELPGHCQQGRACALGDPFASSNSLRAALAPPLRIERIDTDRYGRTLALVRSARGDLSCWQLTHGQAVYKPRWDNDGRLARICTAAR